MFCQIKIEKLSSLTEKWRVDWFGDVAYPDLSRRQSQPSVAVRFSRYPRPRPMGEEDKREVWLPIGLLPFLKVGDVWQNGQATGESTAPSKETFRQLNINADTAQFYKAGGKPRPERFGFMRALSYWLPIRLHPWHSEHTHSNCVIIADRPRLQIIIPCMELIRFYFGSSSSLLSMLFRPTLSRTALAKQYIKRPDGSVFLRLADGISGASAADIARMLYSPEAWRTASLIGKSALSCSSLGLPIYPKCWFPFDGVTDLHVSGQWIRHDESQNGTFIVYEILSCSHEFPFKSVRYVAPSNSDRLASPSQGSQTQAPTRNRQNPKTLLLTDTDPDEKRQTKFVQFASHSSKFPDLEHKTIFKNPSFSISKAQSYPTAPPSAFSVGSTGNGKGITPVEIEAGIEQPTFNPRELPDYFRAGLDSLQHALRFTLMTPLSQAEYTFPVPLIHNKPNNPYPACFIQDENGRIRRRMMGCVQVDYADRAEGVLILEPIDNDTPELIAFELIEELLDLELVKKQLLRYWENGETPDSADDELKPISVTIG